MAQELEAVRYRIWCDNSSCFIGIANRWSEIFINRDRFEYYSLFNEINIDLVFFLFKMVKKNVRIKLDAIQWTREMQQTTTIRVFVQKEEQREGKREALDTSSPGPGDLLPPAHWNPVDSAAAAASEPKSLHCERDCGSNPLAAAR